jgi:hypothetical protein
LLLVEPFDDLGEAQRPNISVELDIELRVVRCWFSEVFQAKDTDVACLLLSFDSELETPCVLSRLTILFTPVLCLFARVFKLWGQYPRTSSLLPPHFQ